MEDSILWFVVSATLLLRSICDSASRGVSVFASTCRVSEAPGVARRPHFPSSKSRVEGCLQSSAERRISCDQSTTDWFQNFEVYTWFNEPTTHLVATLIRSFRQVFAVKPMISKSGNSEVCLCCYDRVLQRFFVCIGFRRSLAARLLIKRDRLSSATVRYRKVFAFLYHLSYSLFSRRHPSSQVFK